MARIHLIDGEKGGVGKSFFARMLIHYFISQGWSYVLVEADKTNPDVKRFYPDEAYDLVFSEAPKKLHQPDLIFNQALKTPVIVNLPAHVFDLVCFWTEKNRLLTVSVSQTYGVDLCKWFLCSGGYDSVQLFKDSLRHFKGELLHVFVKNLGLTDDWDFLTQDQEFQELTAKYAKSIVMMEFPACSYWERYVLDDKQLTLAQALASDEVEILSKQRLLTFQEEVSSAFEQTGLFLPKQQVAKEAA